MSEKFFDCLIIKFGGFIHQVFEIEIIHQIFNLLGFKKHCLNDCNE
jgi:hypothetical protein